MEGCDEGSSLPLIGTMGKQLLKLVDYQEQPRRLFRFPVERPRRSARLRKSGLTRSKSEPSRIDV